MELLNYYVVAFSEPSYILWKFEPATVLPQTIYLQRYLWDQYGEQIKKEAGMQNVGNTISATDTLNNTNMLQ